jgi:putative aldouronate transport system substrate-binding protein
MKARLLALTIVAMMLASALVGCTSAPSAAANSPTVAPTTTTEASTPASTEESGTVTEKPLDWYINYSWIPAGTWGKDWITQEVMKTYGFNVNIMAPPPDGESTNLTTMIASNKLPDIITLDWFNSNVAQVIQAKMVAPLNVLAQQYAPDFLTNADPNIMAWNKQADGNVYGYNCFTTSPSEVKSGPNTYSNDSFLVRKDIYEAIGKPDMSTPEGFLSALKLAKEKFPDSGNGPLIPFGVQDFRAQNDGNGNVGLCSVLPDFLAIPRQKDGKVYDRRTDPEFTRWLKTIRQATQDELMPADVFADNGDAVNEKITNGRYFAMLAQWVDITSYAQAWYTKNPDKAYIGIKGPANTKGDAPTLSCGSLNGWVTSMISTSGGHSENAIQFMAFMVSPKGQELFGAGIEGKTFNKVDGKYVRTDEYKQLIQNDPNNAGVISGVAAWQFFSSNEKSVFFDDVLPSTTLMREMYKPYAVFEGETEYAPFEPNSPAAKAQPIVDTLWDTTLVQLLQAKSDAEFDTIMANYITTREADGYNDVLAEQQRQLDINMQKIANLPNK